MDTTNTTREEHFSEVLKQYNPLIIKISAAYCKDREIRKDLAQEIILHLWQAFPNYNPKYALSTWIYRISLNVSIAYVRKRKSRKKHYEAYSREIDPIHWPDYGVDERLLQLHQMIKNLNPAEKALIVLYLEGCNHSEIGDVMGISVSNVSTRINRIKNNLKDKINKKN